MKSNNYNLEYNYISDLTKLETPMKLCVNLNDKLDDMYYTGDIYVNTFRNFIQDIFN